MCVSKVESDRLLGSLNELREKYGALKRFHQEICNEHACCLATKSALETERDEAWEQRADFDQKQQVGILDFSTH